MQRIKAICYANGMFCATEVGKFALEGFDFRAENVISAIKNMGHGRIDLGFELKVCSAQVEKGNVHAGFRSLRNV